MPSCGSPLVSRIEQCLKNLVANCFRNFSKNKKNQKKKTNCHKCIEKRANIAKITNSIRIASCSKTFLTNFCRNFSKQTELCSIEIACRNRKKACKNRILVTRNFIATKKHPDKYRKNNKNNKVTKLLTYKEKV